MLFTLRSSGLLAAAILTVIVTFVVRWTMLSRAEILKHDQWGAWAAGEVPNFLASPQESEEFFSRLDKIVNKLNSSVNQSPGKLFKDDDFEKEHGQEPNQRRRFVQGSSPTRDVGFVVWSHPSKNDIPPELEKIFRGFANAVQDMYVSEEKGTNSPDTYGEILARALGLNAAGMGPVLTPWIYIATEDGYQATFPANRLTLDERYDPEDRPWFRAIAGTSSLPHLSEPLQDGWRLTVPYGDISQDVTNLVRSVVKNDVASFVESDAKGTPERKSVILSVDIVLTPPAYSRSSLWFPEGWALVQRLGNIVNIFDRLDLTALGVAIAWSFIAVTVVLSRSVNSVFTIALEQSLNKGGDSYVIKRHSEVKRSQELTFAIQSRLMQVATKWIHGHQLTGEGESTVTVSAEWDRRERSKEIWMVEIGKEACFWLFGKRRIRTRIDLYKIVVRFTDDGTVEEEQVMPFNLRVRWEDVSVDTKTQVLDAISREADGESINVGDKNPEGRVRDIEPKVRTSSGEASGMLHRRPDRYGRLYFSDGLAVFAQLYKTGKVNAIVRDVYLPALLGSRSTFLNEGKSVERIILYEDETLWHKIWEECKEDVHNLDGFGGGVWGIAKLADDEKQFRELDFAIVDEWLVVVTERVSVTRRLTGIDAAGDRPLEGRDLKIEGYVSWREGDLQLYKEIWTTIEGRAKKALDQTES